MIFKILYSFLSHIDQHNTVFYKTCIVSLCILVHHFTIIPYRFDVATCIHLFFPSLFKPAEYTFGKKSVCKSILHENQETYTGNSLGKSRRNETSHDRESDENSPTVTNQENTILFVCNDFRPGHEESIDKKLSFLFLKRKYLRPNKNPWKIMSHTHVYKEQHFK